MKGLLGFVVFAMIMVCVSYSDAATDQDVTTSQQETADRAQKATDVVLIVDRNPRVQELKVFENGALTRTLPVSTGRETFDFNDGNYKVNPYCSFTQSSEEFAKAKGLKAPKDFQPTVLREMNVSDTWSRTDSQGNIVSKTKMPNSVFFNAGIAFHAIDTSTEYGRSAEAMLGPKSTPANGGSGACVRLKPDDAKFVFDLFAVKKADGQYSKIDPRKDCMPKPGETPHHKCTDPEQWEVQKKTQTVKIKVIDTRSTEEQDAARKSCENVRSAFLADKAQCLTDKLKPQLVAAPVERQAVTPVPKKKNVIQRFFGRIFRPGEQAEEPAPTPARPRSPYTPAFDLKVALNNLSVQERSRLNEECNRAGHQKIIAGELRIADNKPKIDKPAKVPAKQKTTDGLWM